MPPPPQIRGADPIIEIEHDARVLTFLLVERVLELRVGAEYVEHQVLADGA
jgi:hypothetical protein